MLLPSYTLSSSALKAVFPIIDPKQLLTSFVYYDGQHNDSRMCVYMALTAAVYGAHMLNHAEVCDFKKDSNGKITGVIIRDNLAKLDNADNIEKTIEVKCKTVVNATGPFSDAVLKLDNPNAKNVIVPASGTHIVLSGRHSPKDT
eukprot:UN00877